MAILHAGIEAVCTMETHNADCLRTALAPMLIAQQHLLDDGDVMIEALSDYFVSNAAGVEEKTERLHS